MTPAFFSASGYPPLDTLKAVAPDVWVVDGPIIRLGMRWLGMPFPTRMTVIRLDGRALLVHSPTPLAPSLQSEIETVGTPRWIVGPNRLHFWWLPQWREAYPEADLYLAPRIREQAGGRIDFPRGSCPGATGIRGTTASRRSPCREAI